MMAKFVVRNPRGTPKDAPVAHAQGAAYYEGQEIRLSRGEQKKLAPLIERGYLEKVKRRG